MAIRFHCKRCNQLLGIASRKVGTEIECPKCGVSQIVPSEEAAAASMTMSRFAQSSQVAEEPSDLVVYDDEPAAIESPRRRKREPPDPPRTPSPDQPAVQGPPLPGQPVPQEMILFSRRTVYVQAILFLVVAATGFGAGYFIGRGDASFEMQVAYEEANRERVLIEGKLIYDPGTAKIAGDENAVIIALPDGKYPEERFSITGIRPQDPPPRESNKTIRMLVKLGGVYCRADASGAFSMVVPQQGKYHLLLISRHAGRPKGAEIDEADLREMEEYFRLAEHLVSRYKYRWTLEEVNVGTGPIDHNFGRDGE